MLLFNLLRPSVFNVLLKYFLTQLNRHTYMYMYIYIYLCRFELPNYPSLDFIFFTSIKRREREEPVQEEEKLVASFTAKIYSKNKNWMITIETYLKIFIYQTGNRTHWLYHYYISRKTSTTRQKPSSGIKTGFTLIHQTQSAFSRSSVHIVQGPFTLVSSTK